MYQTWGWANRHDRQTRWYCKMVLQELQQRSLEVNWKNRTSRTVSINKGEKMNKSNPELDHEINELRKEITYNHNKLGDAFERNVDIMNEKIRYMEEQLNNTNNVISS